MTSQDWQDSPASPRQRDFVRDLAARSAMFGRELDRPQTMAEAERLLAEGITGQQASDLIDAARRHGPHPREQMPATDRDIQRAIDYASTHALFGLTCTPEETVARVEKETAGDFFSAQQYRDLYRLYLNAPPHPTAQTPLRLSDIDGIEGLNVSEGHYATFDDDDVLRFYRIYTPASGALRGVGVIRRIAGDNLMGLYPEEAKTVLAAINTDPDTAAFRFSDTFTRCFLCGKNLTDAVSRLLSVGPTCRGFANHTGLRHASSEVDHDPKRRLVFRALREWALGMGFIDPRAKEDRASITMSASRLASAWSGVPGLLALEPDTAVATVAAVHTDNVLSDDVAAALSQTPADTLLILIESGILTAPVMSALASHPSAKVKKAASAYFMAALTSGM